jgi:hypothetical protein
MYQKFGGTELIFLSFALINPFSTRFSSVYCKSGKTLMPHKFWEFGIYKTNAIIRCILEFTTRQDHAGFGVELDLLGWGIEFKVYDNRHWDDEKECWEVYE